VYSDLSTAKSQLEANLKKLKVRAIEQERVSLKSEVVRAGQQGDLDAEMASLREVEERFRQRARLRSRGAGGPQGGR
jgi:hypothetical protein